MLNERTFHNESVLINYAEGDAGGPPLVLLHALSLRWQSSLSLIPALTARWHVFAPDFRGHGRSGWSDSPYNFDLFTADVIAFLEDRVREPAVLYGHSMGGAVALLIAARANHLARAVIVGDNFLYWDSFERLMRDTPLGGLMSRVQKVAHDKQSVEQIAARLAEVSHPVPGGAQDIRLRDMPGHDPAFLRWWSRSLLQLDPEAINTIFGNTRPEEFDGDELLQSVRCPVLLLQAEPALGGVLRDEDITRARVHLPHLVSVRLDGLGHLLQLQDPAPVLRAVTNFIESL